MHKSCNHNAVNKSKRDNTFDIINYEDQQEGCHYITRSSVREHVVYIFQEQSIQECKYHRY